MRKLITATKNGTREEQLKILAATLAQSISCCADEGKLAQLARQYRETIREIDELKGAGSDDDELGAILAQRQSDGKPGAVR